MMIDQCNWDKPGANPYSGSIVEAIDRYADISAETRSAILDAIARNQYERVLITKTGIISLSGAQYDSTIREMHFGKGTVCKNVTRKGWKDYWIEPAKVYHVNGETILVPDVCNNVSRITRVDLHPDDVANGTPLKETPRTPVITPTNRGNVNNKVSEPGSIGFFVIIAAILFSYIKNARFSKTRRV